jgi:hypothetical protein
VFGAAGGGGQERDPDAVDRRSITSADPTLLNFSAPPETPDGELQVGEYIIERRFSLAVEHTRREHPAIRHPLDQQLEQFPRRRRRTVGGVEVAVDRGEQQPHGTAGERP